MNKKFIVLCISALIVCIVGVFVGTHLLYGKKLPSASINDNSEQGILNYNEINSDDLPDSSEEEADSSSENTDPVNIIGYNDLPDIFTITALQRMPQEIRNYLDTHGYADAFNLTIVDGSVVVDRAYPMFQCKIEDTDHILEVRYELSKKEFEFYVK